MGFNTLNQYRDAAADRHGKMSDIGAVGSGSTQRKDIATEMQWVLDNEFALNDPAAQANFEEWADLLAGYGDSSDNFKFGNLSDSKFGGQEVTALGFAVKDLNAMVSDGRITMDVYQEYMTTLFSTETLEDLKVGGQDAFLNACEKIDGFTNNPQDDKVRDANMANAVIGYDEKRPLIRNSSDYSESAKERRGPDNLYSSSAEAEAGMAAALDKALEDGTITQEQRDAMQTYMRKNEVYSTKAYLVEDVLSTGDPKFISEYLTADKLGNLTNDDYAVVDGMVRLDAADRAREAQPGVDGGAMTITPDQVKGLEEMVKGDENRGYSDFVIDNMTADYFAGEGEDRKAPMSYDEYQKMADEFDNIKMGAEKAEYMSSHPEFLEAYGVMGDIRLVGEQIDEAVLAGTHGDGITIELGSHLAGVGDGPEWIETAVSDACNGDHRMPGAVYSEEYVKGDVDAEVSAVNMDLLASGKCPSDRFEDLKEAAQTVWRGGVYGSGQERKDRLAEAGFSPTEIKQIQGMVNMGDKFCANVTAEQFDEVFGEEFGTLAEQDAAYMESVNAMLSYEGGRDFMEAYNEQAGEDSQISVTEAANLYRNAALAGQAATERGEDLTGPDAAGNLADFIADGEKAFDENLRNAGRETETPQATIEKEAEDPQMDM